MDASKMSAGGNNVADTDRRGRHNSVTKKGPHAVITEFINSRYLPQALRYRRDTNPNRRYISFEHSITSMYNTF